MGPVAGQRALRLLAEVRFAQRRSLVRQGLWWAVAAGAPVAVAGLVSGRGWLLAVAGLVAAGVAGVFGFWLVQRRVGDDTRTARLLTADFELDLLAAVELSRALGRADDFSPELARAFLARVDARAAARDVGTLVDARPQRRAALVAMLMLVASVAVTGWNWPSVRRSLSAWTTAPAIAAALPRAPITGDVSLTYRYPAYTGLEPRIIEGTNGAVSALPGTEVLIVTRADRDVSSAALVVNGASVPLRVKGRELTGSFVVDASGTSHVVFLEGTRVVAEGPDMPVVAEPDTAPQVRISSPLDELELDPDAQAVTVKYDAVDDYGLSALALVYRADGRTEQRVPLKPDEGRATRGHYTWSVGALSLRPGATVQYFIEATDNDAVKGPKKAVSRTQRLTLYSAAAHRRDALKKAEALWERLVTHLADRLESPERTALTAEVAQQHRSTDGAALMLASDLSAFAKSLASEREPPDGLMGAAANIGTELNRDVSETSLHRVFYLRVAGLDPENRPQRPASGETMRVVGQRLVESLRRDAEHSEKNVLYLESLLDRAKLQAMKDLAQELQRERRELSRLLEEFRSTKDDATKQALLERMSALKERMAELQARMSELAKGIRDDFMNREAIDEMMAERDFNSKLDDIEKLVREGNAEEAMKQMQALAMQMDQFLEQLQDASDEADAQADPELAREYREFSESLDQTLEEQQALAERTKKIRDAHREQMKERIAAQGAAIKRGVEQKLKELEQAYRALPASRGSADLDQPQAAALRDIENVKQALDANDFDLAAEAAESLSGHASELSNEASEQRRRTEMYKFPQEMQRQAKQLDDELQRSEAKAEEVARALRDVFPPMGSQLSEAERQQVSEQSAQQKKLEQKVGQLKEQMKALGERAPIFDENAAEQLDQASQHMGTAGERLAGKDPSRGYGEQQGAVQSLRGLQQQLQKQQQQRGGGKGGGLPMPMGGQGKGRGNGPSTEKVEIPDDDPNNAPRELRKDVMDAMKQGAPDRYRDQNKRYYEELVK